MDGISVIIPTYNRKQELLKCLTRLTSIRCGRAPHEIIVVDDGSTDGTLETVQMRFPSVRMFRQHNQGPAAARNLGVEKAQYRFLAFTDSDCQVHDAWLDAIYATLSNNPDVGIVGGRTREVSSGILKLLHDPAGDVEAANEPYCSTNNMGVRKEAFRSVGGFDHGFSFACEDVDFCFRVQKQRYKLVANPKMVIEHEHPGNFFGWVRKSYRYEPGLCKFMQKYPETKRFFPFYYLLSPAIAILYAYRKAKALKKLSATLYLSPLYFVFIVAGIVGKLEHIVKEKNYRLLLYIPNLHIIYEKIT